MADLADARFHAECHVPLFDSREAADAFLAGPVDDVEEDLLVGTGLDAFLITATAFLIDQYDAVFFAFVDRLAGTGGQAGGVVAVIADPGQVEHPTVWVPSKVRTQVDHFGQVVFAQIGRGVIVTSGQVALGWFAGPSLSRRW